MKRRVFGITTEHPRPLRGFFGCAIDVVVKKSLKKS